jgi:starch synthase
VHDGDTGFSFEAYSVDAFWEALTRALALYNSDRAAWRAMMLRDMAADFSWATSARGYEQVFTWAQSRMRGW